MTPWMGADTANHYQWYPWHNNGHYEIWRAAGGRGDAAARRRMAEFYRRGLEAVASRADNGFRIGIPFIWCSNNLMTSFATQALLYRRMTGDERFNTGRMVYHDDLGDYSTNEPIMDGTANLTYLLSALAPRPRSARAEPRKAHAAEALSRPVSPPQ